MDIEQVFNTVRGKKVLVIGDMMLDKSIYYKRVRKANEFDGDVLHEVDRTFYPGGAANVAMNCKALGAAVTLLGAFGTDLQGQHLCQVLSNHLIDLPSRVWPSRKWWETTTKTRVYLDGEPLHRIDRDHQACLALGDVLPVIKSQPFELLLLSDYEKGILSDPEFVRQIIAAFYKQNRDGCVAVNPKPQLVTYLPFVDFISLNDDEWMKVVHLLTHYDRCTYVLHTMGSHGLTISHGNRSWRVTASTVDSPDVVGCGDAAFAAASLALCVYPEVNLVGKIAVAAGTAKARKKGTMAVTPEEILNVDRERRF